MVTNVHRGIDGDQEKANPKNIATTQQMRISAHDQCKRFAMAKLVVAPALKPPKNRVETFVWILFQLTVNGDVTGVANFLGQIGRVKNVLGLEVGVGLGALQITQVDPQAKVFQ